MQTHHHPRKRDNCERTRSQLFRVSYLRGRSGTTKLHTCSADSQAWPNPPWNTTRLRGHPKDAITNPRPSNRAADQSLARSTRVSQPVVEQRTSYRPRPACKYRGAGSQRKLLRGVVGSLEVANTSLIVPSRSPFRSSGLLLSATAIPAGLIPPDTFQWALLRPSVSGEPKHTGSSPAFALPSRLRRLSNFV